MNRWALAAWCWVMALLAVLVASLVPDGSVWSGLAAGAATALALFGCFVLGAGLELRKPGGRS